jgi:hypothetical protein
MGPLLSDRADSVARAREPRRATMTTFVTGNLLAPVALAGIAAVLAVGLHTALMWRERLRPGAMALLPVRSRRRHPIDADHHRQPGVREIQARVDWEREVRRGSPDGNGH